MKRSSVVGICVALAMAGTQLTDSVYAQGERSVQAAEASTVITVRTIAAGGPGTPRSP